MGCLSYFLRLKIKGQIQPLAEKVDWSVDQKSVPREHPFRDSMLRREEPDLPQHPRGNFLCWSVWCLLEKLIMQSWYPRAFLGHLLYPQPIHRGAVTNGMKIRSYCILKQCWIINKKAISIWAVQVYQSYQDHLYPQPLHLSGRSSRATSQTRTALASI